MAKTLIAYFSRADENYFGGAMRYVKVGNTEIVCNLMKELIDADTFKIEMKAPYSPVYMTCIEEAKKDLRAGARPALVATSFRRKVILPCTLSAATILISVKSAKSCSTRRTSISWKSSEIFLPL